MAFVIHETKGKRCKIENEIVGALEFLMNNILFSRNHGNPNGINCAPILINFSFTFRRQSLYINLSKTKYKY